MKNYKSILLITVSIIAINNSHITQTYDDSPWDNFWNEFADFVGRLRTGSAYEGRLNQLSNELGNFPRKDRNFIVSETRRKCISEDPQDDERAFRKITSKVIVKRVNQVVPSIAKSCKGTREQRENATYFIVGDVKAFLEKKFIGQNESLDHPRLIQVFERARLKELIQQNIEYSNNQSAYTEPTYSPHPVYPPKQPTYSRPVQKVPVPAKPSNPAVYRISNDDYLEQFQHDLKGIPTSKIGAIVAMGRQEFLRQKPTNDRKKINIMCEAVINCVRIDTRAIASRLTNDQTTVDNTVQSMSENVKERLKRGDNLNGQALAQFFGSSHERMVKQSISSAQSAKKIDVSKPTPEKFAPSAPPAPFALSASEEKELDDGECFICEGDESGKLLSEITHFYKNDQEETLRSCTHPTKVHKKCLNNWLKSSSNRCPSCNLQVEGNVRGL